MYDRVPLDSHTLQRFDGRSTTTDLLHGLVPTADELILHIPGRHVVVIIDSMF